MVLYEKIGDHPDPENPLTSAQVISLIGPPSSMSSPANQCGDYTWIAHFDSPLNHQDFELGLSIDPGTDMVVARGLFKTEYQGLELFCYRIQRLLDSIGL